MKHGHKQATTRLKARKGKGDHYTTPGIAVVKLLERVAIGGTIVEPCSGRRRIAVVLEEHLRSLAGIMDGRARVVGRVITNDKDRRYKADFHLDMLDPTPWKNNWWNPPHAVDWIITNPPFNVAPKLLPIAFEHARVGVALLLRLSILEPCEDRAAFLALHPPQMQIVLPRISFKTVVRKLDDGRVRKSRHDSMTTAWYVWLKDGRRVDVPIQVVPKDTPDDDEVPF